MLSHSCEYTGIQIKLQSQPGAWRNWADGEQGLIVSNVFVTLTLANPFLPMKYPSSMLQRRGVGSKDDRRAGTHFSNRGDKIEPLLTKVVNDDSWRRLEAKK